MSESGGCTFGYGPFTATTTKPFEARYSAVTESLSVTAEYLASNGFVVVAVNGPYPKVQPPDSLIHAEPTKHIQWLVKYVSKFKNVDQDKLMALGFGGGIQPAFYLTMTSDKIKALVNLEGGVFGPRS